MLVYIVHYAAQEIGTQRFSSPPHTALTQALGGDPQSKEILELIV